MTDRKVLRVFRDAYAAAGGRDPNLRQAVAVHVAREELRIRIRAVGGSERDAAEAVESAEARAATSLLTFEDAAAEVLDSWMTGQNRPIR